MLVYKFLYLFWPMMLCIGRNQSPLFKLINYRISRMDKGAKDKLVGSPGEHRGEQDAQKDLHSRTGNDETKRKTQEKMERRSTKSRKRSSSAGSEKMERVGEG